MLGSVLTMHLYGIKKRNAGEGDLTGATVQQSRSPQRPEQSPSYSCIVSPSSLRTTEASRVSRSLSPRNFPHGYTSLTTHIPDVQRFRRTSRGESSDYIPTISRQLSYYTSASSGQNLRNPSPQSRNSINPSPQRRNSANPSPQRRHSANPSPQRRNSANPSPQRRNSINPSPHSRGNPSPHRRRSSPLPHTDRSPTPVSRRASLLPPSRRSPTPVFGGDPPPYSAVVSEQPWGNPPSYEEASFCLVPNEKTTEPFNTTTPDVSNTYHPLSSTSRRSSTISNFTEIEIRLLPPHESSFDSSRLSPTPSNPIEVENQPLSPYESSFPSPRRSSIYSNPTESDGQSLPLI